MFIEARERMINLYLLQNVKVTQIDDKYVVKFIFMNGETYDESYESENEANEAFENYKKEILAK